MNVLLIDDDAAGVRIRAELLRTLGYCTDVAVTGTDGIASVRGGTYDALVLDLILPDRRGSEVLQEVKGIDPTLPVLILSGAIDVEESVRRDADQIIVKGSGVGLLVAALGKVRDEQRTL